MVEFIEEQLAVLEHTGNCVVIARPGSGKTSTISMYIKNRLEKLPEHRGVIAISYTNKASRELASRISANTRDIRASFVGTIDSFFVSEIVIPFGPRVLGRPHQAVNVERLEDLSVPHSLPNNRHVLETGDLTEYSGELARLFCEGIVVLEAVGYLAVMVIKHSVACRRYIQARYSLIVVDEYQDCGPRQHEFFCDARELGLGAVAVGDLDQSIFAFAGKSSVYLRELAASSDFRVFPLTRNHRSHISIVNYSTRLISPSYVPAPIDDPRVFGKRVVGDERHIGDWLTTCIPDVCSRFGVLHRREIGILVRNNRTADYVASRLGIPFRNARGSTLDEEVSPWGNAFRMILRWLFDAKITRRELLDEALPRATRTHVHVAVEMLTQLEDAVGEGFDSVRACSDLFLRLAELIVGSPVPDRGEMRLREVLGSDTALEGFAPPRTSEVQLMTIHKSKGLEFDIVFHLDLYEWILPNPKGDPEQDLNLHYVALTRARKACFLCCTTHRHNAAGRQLEAKPSSFYRRNGVNGLAIPSPF